MTEERRVVVTGLGAVTPLGNTAKETWKNLVAGESGIESTVLDPEFNIAGTLKDFDPESVIGDRKLVKITDSVTHLALAAGLEAVADAELSISEDGREDVGVSLGVGIGGITTTLDQYRTLLERGPRRVSARTIPMIMANATSGNLATLLKLQGPNYVVSTACASANDATVFAYKAIKDGDANVMITGGAEDASVDLVVAAFGNMKALRKWAGNPEEAYRASRPFDANRAGFVLAKGSAMFVLESLEHAIKRDARIYAELVGYGQTDDAYHITDMVSSGATRALQMGLKKSGLKPDQIQYIAAHGTSTPINDARETEALKNVFGEHAYQLLISSPKSMIGHTIGAAGAVNSLAVIKAIETDMIPPTINYETPDPDCDLNYVPNKAVEAKVDAGISDAFGFGGHNSILVFQKFAN